MSGILLHFTGRNKSDNAAFKALESICTKSELWLSYCPTFKGETWQKDVWMTCKAQGEALGYKFGKCCKIQEEEIADE